MTERGDTGPEVSHQRPTGRIEAWEHNLSVLSAEAAEIKAAGGWRRGPRTMLQLLSIEQSELRLVKILGWLLSPNGHHGLGNSVVAALLTRVGIPYIASDVVTVRLEESRLDPIDSTRTRADLVLRVGRLCVLIEAKVWAIEQPEQCDRLARLWRDENPELIFLTPWGNPPSTATRADNSWVTISWEDIADIVSEALSANNVDGSLKEACGAWDYVQTLQLFQSGQRSSEGMSDESGRFYARHWEQLEEWVAMRAQAVATIDTTMRVAFTDCPPLIAARAVPNLDLSSPRYPTFELYRASWRSISIAVQWQPQPNGGNPWPYVGIRTHSGAARHKQIADLNEALQQEIGRLGWLEHKHGDPFLCWKHIVPADGDLFNLGNLCRIELENGWRELADRIDDLLSDD
ncbi:PD-(D/E)XK nuclease family protein [Micromonospora sp. U21]|uniref:PD-(D/E)XK nuclease family protein n=1 Tax=Micromonospora sp. U21 TaxID=2824899 RepID=UPI001B365500|nr:PD-(D/E)XK nuclease family protein [Micromonospora sp. U21]MBQ0905520.1 PD-(D/E)XK nuclease family protein [Micromonospora sp. U21]